METTALEKTKKPKPAPAPEKPAPAANALDLAKPVKIAFVRFVEAITVMTHTAPSVDSKVGVANGRIMVDLDYYPGFQLLAVRGRKSIGGEKFERETELVPAVNIKQMRVA